jgi:P-type conjugative transfer protein TrbJ
MKSKTSLKYKRLVPLSIALAYLGAPNIGHASAIVGATEITQILNMIQLGLSYVEQASQTVQQVQMVSNQLNQYANMLQNTRNLSSFNLENLTSLLSDLRNLVNNATGLSYAASNVEARYDATHKGYAQWLAANVTSTAYSTQLANWQAEHRRITVDLLKKTGRTEADFATEESTIAALKGQLTTQAGVVQAVGVGNSVAMEQVAQLQKLRAIMVAMNQAHVSYASLQEERKTAEDAQTQKAIHSPDSVLGAEHTF